MQVQAVRFQFTPPTRAAGGVSTSEPQSPDSVTLGPTYPKPTLQPRDVFVDPPAPVGKLPRPVLLIPGGRSRTIGLSTISHYLTTDGNNEFGGPYCVNDRQKFEDTYKQHGGDVFCLKYSEQFGSFEHNAGEIKQAIDDIRRLTGAAEIDVVAECKGAMEFRQYLSEGNDGVRNVVLLVPPARGLVAGGDIVKAVANAVDIFHLPIKKLGAIEVTPESLKAMKEFSTDWSIGRYHNNPRFAAYNSAENQARESAVCNSLTVVAGDGENLFEQAGLPGAPFPLFRGDASVPRWSAYLPHAENFFYTGSRAQHARVNSHPGALAKITEALLTDGHPTRDEAFVDHAPPPVKKVALRSAAWTASFAGRVGTLKAMIDGTTPGQVSTVLGWGAVGLSTLDAGFQIKHAVEGTEPRLKAGLGATAKLAQATGMALALTGTATGWLPIGLIGGGILVSAWSWT